MGCLVLEVQEGLLPVNGKILGNRIQWPVITLNRATTAKAGNDEALRVKDVGREREGEE